MDILKKCAEIFEKYISKKYTFVLDCNMSVDVIFNSKQFHHLLGLQYLTDIAQVDTRGKGNFPYKNGINPFTNKDICVIIF